MTYQALDDSVHKFRVQMRKPLECATYTDPEQDLHRYGVVLSGPGYHSRFMDADGNVLMLLFLARREMPLDIEVALFCSTRSNLSQKNCRILLQNESNMSWLNCTGPGGEERFLHPQSDSPTSIPLPDDMTDFILAKIVSPATMFGDLSCELKFYSNICKYPSACLQFSH